MVLVKRYLTEIILILVVIVLFVAIGFGIRDFYVQNLRFRLDPLEERSIAVDMTDQDILALGSSSIRRWPFGEMNIIGNRIYNAGIDGQTSRQILLRFERLLKKQAPRFLIFQAGLNDIKSIGFINSSQQIEHEMLENLKSVLELCMENSVTAVFVTNFPTGKRNFLRSLVWNRSLDRLIFDTNEKMKNYCISRNIEVFDAYAYLKRSNSLKRKNEYSLDFFHLNAEGYALLNRKMEIELNKIVNQI
ncbi:MAG TPA: GDSL-type esterase/lipase family protein [Bacteroidales bacterium]|jgi:lysophospholipase L1-like esterase|nr:GDSL-type esterase/lipase family protein [Bacteroidales bacterium]